MHKRTHGSKENLLFEQCLFDDHETEVLLEPVRWVIALHFGFGPRVSRENLNVAISILIIAFKNNWNTTYTKI